MHREVDKDGERYHTTSTGEENKQIRALQVGKVMTEERYAGSLYTYE